MFAHHGCAISCWIYARPVILILSGKNRRPVFQNIRIVVTVVKVIRTIKYLWRIFFKKSCGTKPGASSKMSFVAGIFSSILATKSEQLLH